MYVTPGPNNAMVLTSGLKFGFLKTIPHISGITIGHILQLILVCLGLGKIFQIFPMIQNILKIVCALYLVYLGYKIIGSFSKIKEDDSRPLKFYEAALFQIVNPKAWTISSMAASGFLPKDGNLIISIFFIASIALIICPLSISPWAAFGAAIRNLVKNNKIKGLIEYFLAFLLLITAILIVIQ
ncbi:MAG: lysine transporter LysE [Candidatus Pelagibacter sp.]|nr:lysine transporter LysE [Candidatus Pelagibacter sp.]